MSGQWFHAGVVIVVRHPDRRQVLAFERSDAAGSWQLPQGGFNEGETPIEGASAASCSRRPVWVAHVVARAEYPDSVPRSAPTT